MNLRSMFLLCALLLLSACGVKESFVVLSPGSDGSVGALQVATDSGAEVLKEEGKAIYVGDRHSPPSAPMPIDNSAAQQVFEEALRVHPLMPESFLLYFQFNSNALTEESARLIGDILLAIQKRQSRDVSVIGHTDRAGSDEYNRKLSLERAQLVYDLLREKNVAAADMTIIYHGEGNPLVPTADNIAEPRNRRVEVMVR